VEHESNVADVGRDTTWVPWNLRPPTDQMVFIRELDGGEKAFLAPPPPASSDEGTGAEAGMGEVVDDFVDELLGQ
jgi:hypothetical protein